MRSTRTWMLAFAVAVAPLAATGTMGCTPGPAAGDGGEAEDGGPGADAGGGGGNDARFCAQACTQDADCEIDGFAFLKCIDDRCIADPDAEPGDPACDTDAECVALLNAWTLADSDADFIPDAPCTASNDDQGACPSGEVCCAPGQVCTQNGWCANPPFEDGGCTLFGPGFAEVTLTDVDDNDATVCQKARSDDAVCLNPGGAGAACYDPCNIDDDCAQDPLGAVCNTGTGTCGCSSDDDCDHTGTTQGYDACQSNGTCGCSGDDVCPDAYSNSTGVCE